MSARYPLQRVCPGCDQIIAARANGVLRSHATRTRQLGGDPTACPRVVGEMGNPERDRLTKHGALGRQGVYRGAEI